MKRLALSALIIVAWVGTVQGQWIHNGAPVCVQPYGQEYPEVCSDGEGGMIMTWNDYRTPEFPYLKGDVYAQRIDAFGNVLWTTDGVAVCLASDDQWQPLIVSDGAGGAILVWADLRNNATTGADIYARRIDGDGTPLWTTDGVPVCDTTNIQQYPVAVSDGRGGAIVAWQDYRNATDYDIYAQRIDQSGSRRWSHQGEALCTAVQWQEDVQIVTDGEDGAIVVWEDSRPLTHTDVYAQRVDSTGTTKWPTDGYAICYDGSNQSTPVVAPDGFGGAVIAWSDMRNGNSDIFAQWIMDTGSQRWATNGVSVCSATNSQNYPVVLGNGLYGAFFAWRDQRNGNVELFAQRIDTFGGNVWTADGIKIVDEIGTEGVWDVVSDGAGGLIVSWIDSRTGAVDVYTQRVDEDGNNMWASGGVTVSDEYRQQTVPELLSDGSGGCFVVWQDERIANGNYDIYAQRVERNGYWGYPGPSVTGVEDVPADQGGELTVRFDASRLDTYVDADITHYSVWRSITGGEAAALAATGARDANAAGVGAAFTGPAVRVTQLEGTTYYWEWVGNMDAHFLEHYAFSASTQNDSMPGNGGVAHFFVSAHTADPFVFWDSQPDSGYSVDNLAPCAPAALAGAQSTGPVGLDITWESNDEFDLSHYNVYRGATVDFVPGPGNRIHCGPDTTTFDGDWRWHTDYFYKVSAVDIHGNESDYASMGPDNVTGTDPAAVPRSNYLAQNYPNPFNPVTTIRFGLNAPAFVSLTVYDATGRAVRQLAHRRYEAGVHDEAWDGRTDGGREAASGVYFYRLVAGDLTSTRKMVLLR